ncbi:putative uncharacterized protein [Tannerella sp. CAG:118]|nr:putative uncharacterized protein [Tannerella sp. CAG:118]
MLAVCTLLQHFQETAHDRSILRRNITIPINAGVEVKEVENRRLHGVDKRFPVKAVLRVPDTLLQQVEIAAADNLLLRCKVHDRIEEKGQRPLHPIIALRRTQVYKTGSSIDYPAPEILRRLYPVYQLPFADNGQIPRMQLEIPFIETVTARPSQTKQVRQILLIDICLYHTEGIGNDYIFLLFHASCPMICKISDKYPTISQFHTFCGKALWPTLFIKGSRRPPRQFVQCPIQTVPPQRTRRSLTSSPVRLKYRMQPSLHTAQQPFIFSYILYKCHLFIDEPPNTSLISILSRAISIALTSSPVK